jgi:hypothetical protein
VFEGNGEGDFNGDVGGRWGLKGWMEKDMGVKGRGGEMGLKGKMGVKGRYGGLKGEMGVDMDVEMEKEITNDSLRMLVQQMEILLL